MDELRWQYSFIGDEMDGLCPYCVGLEVSLFQETKIPCESFLPCGSFGRLDEGSVRYFCCFRRWYGWYCVWFRGSRMLGDVVDGVGLACVVRVGMCSGQRMVE